MISTLETLDRASTLWWPEVFHATWQTALVAGLLLAVVWLAERWPAPLKYGLLLLALLKFAWPPLLPVPTGVFSRFAATAGTTYSRVASAGSGSSAIVRPASAAAPVTSDTVDPEVWMPRNAADGTATPSLGKLDRPRSTSGLHWLSMLMVLHAAGSLAVVAWLARQFAWLGRTKRRAQAITAGAVWEAFHQLSRQLGLRKSPRLMSSAEVGTPVAFGLLRPTVLLPEALLQKLSLAEMRPILAHELAHCRRGDLWINWLQLLLLVLWWFHPLLWTLNRTIRRIREDCCDDLLLEEGLTSREHYCDILIRAARELTSQVPVRAALGFAMQIHPLGRRVARIMDRTIQNRARLSPVGLALLTVSASLLLPGLRSQELKPAVRVADNRAIGAKAPAPTTTSGSPTPESFDEIFVQLRWVGENNFYFEKMQELSRRMGTAGVAFLLEKAEMRPGQIENGRTVEQRRKAIMALGFIAPTDQRVVPALVQALKDDADLDFSPKLDHDVHSIRVSAMAADALGHMKSEASNAVPALLEAIKAGNVRALIALVRIDPQSPVVLEALTEAMHAPFRDHHRPLEGNYQLTALDALGILAPRNSAALAPLEATLADSDADLRDRAAKIIVRLSEASPEVRQIVAEKLKASTPVEQAHLAAAAAWAGGRSDEIYAALIAALRSNNSGMQRSALDAIVLFDPRARELVPLILKVAATENELLRAKALEALARIGGEQPEAVDLAIENLRAKDSRLRMDAFQALARLGKSASRAEPLLLELLHDKEPFTRRAAAEVLGQIGASAYKAVPALKGALEDPKPLVRGAAIVSLANFGPASLELLPVMIQMLDGTNALAAESALARLGPRAEPAVPALVKALGSSDEQLRSNAANTLGSIGPAAESAVPALRAALRDDEVRNSAVSALGRIGAAARPAIPELVSAMTDKAGHVRYAAAVALWRIDGRTDVVRLISQRLQSEEQLDSTERPNVTSVHVTDLWWLRQLGPGAKAAIPAVEMLVHDQHDVVRAAAIETLAKLRAFDAPPTRARSSQSGDGEAQ